MRWRTWLTAVMLAASATAVPTAAQTLWFDFENAPTHSPLPLSLTVGEVTAEFSATGQGFSIQPANTMGFTPSGFSGNCIYPSSVFAADLLVAFSQGLSSFAILYAPQELACDSSARMRVTAYRDGLFVGTSTMTADPPGTWPSATLAISSRQPFNQVVVHYDAPPPTGGDWGPIFMADNLQVTLAPPPIVLTDAVMQPGGEFQFAFTNSPGLNLSVFASTNSAASFSQWIRLGSAIETTPGQYHFIDGQAPAFSARFYRVSSP